MKIDSLKPIVKAKANDLIAKCRDLGINIGITSTYRTFAEQDALYAQGRTKPGSIVTNAKAGQSFHNYGVAFDIVEIKDGKYVWDSDWAKIWRVSDMCGLEWGGGWASFPDRSHFQYTGGYTLSDFQNGKVPEDTFVDRNALLKLIETLKAQLALLLSRRK